MAYRAGSSRLWGRDLQRLDVSQNGDAPRGDGGIGISVDIASAPMRAIQISEFGGPEVMKLVELPTPEPGPERDS